MKQNAFTLIELLAVIVILAIIALIAVPIVLNIIDDTKTNAEIQSINFYGEAVEQAIARYQLKTPTIIKGEFEVYAEENEPKDGRKIKQKQGDLIINVDYDGNVVCSTINIKKNGSIYLYGCEVDGKYVEHEYGVPAPKSFAEDSWETIAANVKSGNTDVYKVGDTKEIKLEGFTNEEKGSNGLYTVRIANKTNTTDVCTKDEFETEDGTKETYSKTACGFVIEFVDIIERRPMNSSSTNVGGWNSSSMRTYVNDTIYNALPEDLRDVIMDTKVVSGYGYNDAPNKESTDKLYLLSTQEVWEQGTSNTINCDTARANTRQLDYYKSIGVTTINYSGAIKKYNSSASWWWLRSAFSNYADYFYIVGNYGDWGGSHADYSDWVAPAFRIG